jgi:hypothetical protein
VATASTADITKCQVPPLATAYSVQNYNIVNEKALSGSPFASNSSLITRVFDG